MNRNVAIACVALVAAGCAGTATLSSTDPAAQYVESVRRMTRASAAFQMYASDYDDMFATAGNWMDQLMPYVVTERDFVSPAFDDREGQYGYALNSSVAGLSRSQVESPGDTLAIFDSTITVRNATAGIDTLPDPPRYTHNTRAFADGTVADEFPVIKTILDEATSRMKSLSLGALMYSGDYDDFLPLASWQDPMMPYIKSQRVFSSPVFPDPSGIGWAMNADAVSKNQATFESPTQTYLFFDSTVLERNAVSDPSTRPVPGRYEGKNVWSFVDGHVVSG